MGTNFLDSRILEKTFSTENLFFNTIELLICFIHATIIFLTEVIIINMMCSYYNKLCSMPQWYSDSFISMQVSEIGYIKNDCNKLWLAYYVYMSS